MGLDILVSELSGVIAAAIGGSLICPVSAGVLARPLSCLSYSPGSSRIG